MADETKKPDPIISVKKEAAIAKRTIRQWLNDQPPYIHVLIWLGLVAVSFGVNHYGFNGQTVINPPGINLFGGTTPEPLASPANEYQISRDGWAPDADANDRDARTVVFKNFADTPAGQVGDIPREVFLWQAETKLTGKPTLLCDQNPTGSCVGCATARAIERTLAADIVQRNGQPSEFAHFSEEVAYAGPKVQGAKSLGASVSNRDGSAGVFVKAYFANGYGMVPKAKYGAIDLTEYDAARAKSWNVTGPPAALLAEGKKYPVKDAAKVTSWDQAKKAIASGYGVLGCASWSYSGKRDSNGIAAETREGWNHAMAIDGYCTINGREYGHVENSWSNVPDKFGVRHGPYHTGPVGPGNPTSAGFWASAESLDRALKQGDSYALSGATGFPARKLPPLDWAARPVRKVDALALNSHPFRGKLWALNDPTHALAW